MAFSQHHTEVRHLSFPTLIDFGQCMPGGFFVYKAYGNEELLYANDIVFDIFGCDSLQEFKELTGYTFPGMVYGKDLERIECSIVQQVEKHSKNLDYVEYRICRKDGKIRWVDDYGRLVRTIEYGDVFYVLVRDITDQHNLREALTDTDHLTKAYNRRHFDRELQNDVKYLLHYGGRLCMVMMDIDKFKNFNDLYGHLAGDQCLISVAGAMNNALQRKSDMLFRYGGEEFAILLPGASLNDALVVAEKVRYAVRTLGLPHEQGPAGIVTVSAGVALLEAEDALCLANPCAELIRLADAALYEAKEAGRDTVKTQNALFSALRSSTSSNQPHITRE